MRKTESRDFPRPETNRRSYSDPEKSPLPVEEVESVVENVLTDIDAAFESIFQWALQIGSKQNVAKELLVRLAHDRPINDVGTNEQRTTLLELYCNRDLLEKKSDHPAGYDYQVPLMKEWVKNKYIVT
ncbi:MAG: hypothetical protein HC876_23160 [Chloroflexaceae bacterium]|nr:hypothetical protein [Chloroflexaceae bacterium]